MIPQAHLEQYAKELDAEIKRTEESIRSLQAKLEDLQRRRAAVSYLEQPTRQHSGTNGGNAPSGSAATPWAVNAQRRRRTTGNGHREQTLYSEFDRPLLESLVALGGKSSAEEVLQNMKSRMAPILKPRDFDVVSSGEERWRNTARWRRNALVKLGLLKPDSPRGIWEITDAGKAWAKKVF